MQNFLILNIFFIFSYVNNLNAHFLSVIQTLGEQLKLRQQVIATATVYFKRFYARNSLKCIDPLLLAPTCIFLASKVEEFGVISNSRLITTCQTVSEYLFCIVTYILFLNVYFFFDTIKNVFFFQLKINLVMRTVKNFLIEPITSLSVSSICLKIWTVA